MAQVGLDVLGVLGSPATWHTGGENHSGEDDEEDLEGDSSLYDCRFICGGGDIYSTGCGLPGHARRSALDPL